MIVRLAALALAALTVTAEAQTARRPAAPPDPVKAVAELKAKGFSCRLDRTTYRDLASGKMLEVRRVYEFFSLHNGQRIFRPGLTADEAVKANAEGKWTVVGTRTMVAALAGTQVLVYQIFTHDSPYKIGSDPLTPQRISQVRTLADDAMPMVGFEPPAHAFAGDLTLLDFRDPGLVHPQREGPLKGAVLVPAQCRPASGADAAKSGVQPS